MSVLDAWGSFYVIVGSAGGALVGLQFVVLTIIAERLPLRAAQGAGAFTTPTVVHFAAVLFISAVLQVPWHSFEPLAAIWGVSGLGGIVYCAIVARRMRALPVYRPVFEDWLFHVLLPGAGYALLGLSGLVAVAHTRAALFGVGATTLLFLFIGIHNAWDAVVFHALADREPKGPGDR